MGVQNEVTHQDISQQDVNDDSLLLQPVSTYLPKKWRRVKLGEIFTQIAKKYCQVKIEDDRLYRLLTVKLYALGVVLRKEEEGARIGTKVLFQTNSGDFVFSKIDARNGAWGFVSEKLAGGLVSGDFPIWHLNRRQADQLFIEYALFRPLIWMPLRDIAVGTTNRRRVQPKQLADITIPLPPLPEQHAIVRTLHAVQQAIQTRRDELEIERERKAALMEYLFTHDSGSAPTKKTKFGNVPLSWKLVPLEQCAFVQTGIAKGRKLADKHVLNLPYLRVANVQDGYLDLSDIKYIELRESEVERYELQSGDVVVTEGGDFDKLGRGFLWKGQIPNCVHQNHIFAVRVNQKMLIPEYFAYLIQSNYGKAYFLSVAHRTTNLASINSTKLKAFPTLIPSLSEQKDIVTIIDACDAKITSLEQELILLEELFGALLEELMTGRLSTLPLIEKGEIHV